MYLQCVLTIVSLTQLLLIHNGRTGVKILFNDAVRASDIVSFEQGCTDNGREVHVISMYRVFFLSCPLA
jgi:hypothetical protein